jgi:Xaa-Pro aminopeptidase
MSEYPRFSPAELARRRSAVEETMAKAGVSHLLAYGASGVGGAVGWISEWPATHEAALLVTPGEQDVLLVQHYNHLPNARRIATDADVRWGGPDTVTSLIDLLGARGATSLGVMGPLRFAQHQRLSEAVDTVVALDADYVRLRLVKSAEEIERLREAARLTDAAVAAMTDAARPGADVRALAAATEGAYLAAGATNQIHYFAVTAMADPQMCVPGQFEPARLIQAGDVLTCEISANYWGYSGQLLRTFTIASDPTPHYAALHAAADAAFDAITASIRPGAHASEIVDASAMIEEAGFTIFDDLVHGYGGGYLPPVLGTRSRSHRPIPDMRIEEGMCLVVQPNVITTDEKSGVQTGQMGWVDAQGWHSLHDFPRGLVRLG